MSKSEAAEAIALQVTVFANKHQQPFTMTSVWEVLSDCQGGYRGEYLAAAARIANHKTVYRLCVADAKLMGRYHLIGA